MDKLRQYTIAAWLTLLLHSTHPAFSQDFRGAFDMLSEDDMTDHFMVSNVLQRCSGLYGSLAKFLPKCHQILPEFHENF